MPPSSNEVLHLKSQSFNHNSDKMKIIKAVICAGLYPNIIRIQNASPSSSSSSNTNKKSDINNNQTTLKFYTKKNEEVFIHPSSVVFNLPKVSENEKWLIYHEKVKTTKVYLRDATVISPYPLLLFGGQINVLHEKQLIELDQWIQFRAHPKIGVLMKQLRRELDKLLLMKIENPQVNLSDMGQNVIDTIATLLATEHDQPTTDGDEVKTNK